MVDGPYLSLRLRSPLIRGSPDKAGKHPAGGFPTEGVLHTAPRTHSHGGGSPYRGAGLAGALVGETRLAGVGTGSGGGEGGGLCEVESLVGEMCVGPEEGGRCLVGGRGEAGVVAVRGQSDGDEVEELEEADDGQFQCGDGDVEVADCGDGVMKLEMTEDGVVVGDVCGEVGDLDVAMEEVGGVLGAGGEVEASAGVEAHLGVGHDGTGVHQAGAVVQRVAWACPAGILDQCLLGVEAQ
ncbi:hypothetical protein E2C01_002620 [Portunus trituberculatus]|uniref:Uncharacterized protein n=1 Tax=Portunus trituberculatus TaxID=210409 RepID=A0A5B7CNQ8_PORTR|nr:hypothetical protein [Portunus trituberculatus]